MPQEPKKTKEDNNILENPLRPNNLNDFIGQSKIKKNFRILVEAASQRKEPIEHTLLYGPPGLGKTSLAYVLAKEMNVNIRPTSGPAIERTGDLASIITNLQPGDILFIDEIHRLNKPIEETLYSAMEDFCLDVIIGKGPSARTLRLELPKFTIIGATTRIGLISSPLRDRFGIVHKLNFYPHKDLIGIIKNNAQKLTIQLTDEAAQQIAARSRGTPRIAIKLLKRARDVAQIKKNPIINDQIIHEAMQLLEIDALGLNALDRHLLKILIEKHGGGPAGLSTIAAAISEDTQTIEDFIEPYLLQIGLLKRTPRGRQATSSAYQHLNITQPQQQLI